MKRIICLVLAVVMITAMFCGCAAKRELFDVNLSKHLTLGDYKNIVVDKTATEYTDYRDYVFENYVANANAYEQVTTGTVADGDTVNINYTGKKDGVAFEGGTAENQLLVIGSKSFIDGFESGLIGKEVGSTVDLNLTFPSDYGATDLAGKAVVFTVKINYVQKMPEINDATAVKLGFETSDKLNEELDKQATNYIIVQYLTKNSSVDKYSKNDKAIFDKEYEDTIAEMQTYATNYQMSLDDFLTYYVGTTQAALQANITSQMEGAMIIYAVADAEELKIDKTLTEDFISRLATDSGMSVAQVRENYQAWELENYAVQELVLEHITKNYVTIK